MRSFIRMSVAVLALFVVANVATAQGGGGGGGGGGQGRGGPPGQRAADRLLTGITIDSAKVAPVIKWYDDEFAKLPPMGRGGDMDSTTRAKIMADRAKLTTDFQGKLKALLTPEQVKTFETNIATAAAARGRGRGGE